MIKERAIKKRRRNGLMHLIEYGALVSFINDESAFACFAPCPPGLTRGTPELGRTSQIVKSVVGWIGRMAEF